MSMLLNLIPCILLIAVYAVGVVLLDRTIDRQHAFTSRGERIFLALGSGMVLLAVSAMILSLFGWYRILTVLLFYLLCTAFLYYIGRSFAKKEEPFAQMEQGKTEKTLLAVMLLAAVLYLAFPSYYMWAGRDYGIYVINAVHTAETGSSHYETDEFLNTDYERLNDVIELGYPAFYSSYEEGISEKPGDINAQFLPMYWSFLAIGYSLFGFGGLFRITALLSLAALGVFYFLIKRFFGGKAATAATAVLAVCPAQIWGARITQSEQLAQLLFFLTAAFFAIGWQKNRNGFLHVAVALVGLGYFCRMDYYIVGVGIICVGIYSLIYAPDKRKQIFCCQLQHLMWFLTSLAYGFAIHTSYYVQHWNKGVLKKITILCVLLEAVYFGLYPWIVKKNKSWNHKIKELSCKKYMPLIVASAAALAFFLCYFIRPMVKPGDLLWDSLRQYCFYICPLLLLFASAGAAAVLCAKTKEEYRHKTEPLLFLIGTGLISVALYTLKPSITMDHFFMSRRWIVVNFPILIMLAGAGFFALWNRKTAHKAIYPAKQGILVICAIAVIGYIGRQDLILWKHSAYQGLVPQMEQLAERIPDHAVVLTADDEFASLLKIVYHKNVYRLKENPDFLQLQEYLQDHDNVYLLGDIQNYVLFWGVNLEPVSKGSVCTKAPERSKGYYPKEVVSETRNTDLYRLSAKETDTVDILNIVKYTEWAQQTEEGAVLTGTGTAFFGPYCRLEPGAYELIIEFGEADQKDEPIGTMELVVNEEVTDTFEIEQTDGLQSFEFQIAEEDAIVQTRFQKNIEDDVICTLLQISK